MGKTFLKYSINSEPSQLLLSLLRFISINYQGVKTIIHDLIRVK